MKKVIDFLLLLLIFFLPLQTAYIVVERQLGGVKWQYGTELLYATQLLLGVVMIIQLVLWWRQRRPSPMISIPALWRRRTMFTWLLFGLVVWLLCSLWWSADAALSWYYVTQVLLAVAFGMLLQTNKINGHHLAWALSVSGLVQSLIIFWQWGNQYVAANSWLGISEKFAAMPGMVVVLAPDERWLRAAGMFTHPNIAGGFLALAGVATVWLALHASVKTRRYALALLPVLVFALGLTFSRGAALAFGCGIIVVMARAVLEKMSRLKVVALALLLAISISAFVGIHFDLVTSRLQPATTIEQRSISERVSGVDDAISRIASRSLLGTGVGTYTLVSSQQQPGEPAWAYQPVHNVWLLVASEWGVIGVGLFGGIFAMSIWRNRKSGLMIGLLAVLCIISLFDHYLWTSWSGLLLWWMVVLEENKDR